MVLSRLTRITGPGVSTDTNWVGNNANFTGVTTSGSSFNIGVTTIHSNLIEAHNIVSTGVVTAISFSGDGSGLTGVANTDFVVGTAITMGTANFTGNVTIGGTLTYEDVTNIDSVGIITAQKDIHVGAGVSVVGIVTAATGDFDDFVDVGSNIKLGNAGVITATSFVGSGAALTGLDKQITIGMRAGVAVTFAATGSSFNVVGRSGNIPISF